MGDPNPNLNGYVSENDSDDDDFSFSMIAGASAADLADEIFSNGKILPFYPLFNRTLLLSDPDPNPSELRSVSASSAKMAAAQNYCEWSPNRRWKKSGSTGSGSASSKWCRVRALVGGKRSHGDGKENIGYLHSGSELDSGRQSRGQKREMDLGTAYKLLYGKEKVGREKKSILVYKPELVGLFTKGSARHHGPFNL